MLVSQLINNSSSLNQYRLKYDGSSDISSSFIFCLFNGLFENTPGTLILLAMFIWEIMKLKFCPKHVNYKFDTKWLTNLQYTGILTLFTLANYIFIQLPCHNLKIFRYFSKYCYHLLDNKKLLTEGSSLEMLFPSLWNINHLFPLPKTEKKAVSDCLRKIIKLLGLVIC